MSRPALDLRVYLITDTALCGRRGVAATVHAAVAGGATAVQVREPSATGRALYELAVAVHEQLSGTGIPLLVDDRLDVALAAGAEGVHLGQHDLPAVAARAVAGPDLLIGWSVTNVAQAEEAARFPPGTVDYLGVGPVFPTSTKANPNPVIGPEGLAAVCARAAFPCVGIGGIDAGNVARVVSAGAAGAAVISAICSAPDAEAATRGLRQAAGW